MPDINAEGRDDDVVLHDIDSEPEFCMPISDSEDGWNPQSSGAGISSSLHWQDVMRQAGDRTSQSRGRERDELVFKKVKVPFCILHGNSRHDAHRASPLSDFA